MSMPDKAFILAAGKGTRMRPLTDTLPKPMICIDGKPMIDHTIDALKKDGIKQIGINLHYFGNKLEEHLAPRDDVKILFFKEHVLLDTGGGIRNATRKMGDNPFFILSGDSFWTDGGSKTVFQRLTEAWDPEKMDMLFLLQPVDKMQLTKGVGDYVFKEDGRIERKTDQSGTHMFTSIRIMKPTILRGTPDGPFSFLDVMDKCEREEKLYGLEHDGQWHHISTPKDVEAVNTHLKTLGAA